MKKLFSIAILFTILSCSIERQIVGNWQITSYAESGADGSNANAVNIGTISFDKDGTGSNDLSFSILGAEKNEQNNFSYSIGDESVTIKTDDNSDLAKSWLVIESKAKMQKWKSTDGKGNVQVLELVKKEKE